MASGALIVWQRLSICCDHFKMSRFVLLTTVLSSFLIKSQCYSAPSVVIVGAGPTGIAAASKLLQNNFTDITILEAENRIGGRIYSVKFGDAFIDLGAQWCHGIVDNVVYEMVKDLDLLRPGDGNFNYLHSSDEDLNVALVNKLWVVFNIIYADEKPDNTSLGDYVTKRYIKYVVDKYGEDSRKLELGIESLRAFIKFYLSIEGAFSLFDVSAKYDYKLCEGNSLLNWKGRGYKTILDVLMQRYPNPENQLPIDDKILLNKEVTKVSWDNRHKEYSEKTVVKCKDGSVYYTDHVIFTPSVGVLKKNYKSLFQPPLPKTKVNVIKSLGFDAVLKLFLHFPIIWWPGATWPELMFVWSEEDRKHLAEEFPEGPIKNGMSWLNNLMSLSVVNEENPNLLAAWFVGEFVPDIERCSDDLLIDGIMFVLNKFTGHKITNLIRPDAVIRNNWYSNPHFRGTYSYQTIASRQFGESPEIILSKPLTTRNGEPSLLFAGEATHPIYYSTVHGAIESGFREANRIIDIYD